MTIKTVFYWLLLLLSIILSAVFAAIWFSTFHPNTVQAETIECPVHAPILSAGQKIKLYNQNVQFMAGKKYVFFYDLPNNTGPDERPSTEAIQQTLQGLAALIKQHDPDIILLQEVDDGAKRSDHTDQLAQLLARLPSDYLCHASSFYWKARYVPHPRIMGAVGTKLSIISKYKITEATRLQLSLIPQDPISQLFNLKRALLDIRLPISGGQEIAILNTHLSAFSKKSGAIQQQIIEVDDYLSRLNTVSTPWIIGGDFNLLPPHSYALLAKEQRYNYESNTAIKTLYQHYSAIPALKKTQSKHRDNWFTYFPNDPRVNQPDRTIDYYFYSPQLQASQAHVEQTKALTLSDHMPIIATFTLP